jgi:glycosyltransferase involved in cell wall biosynthesis
MTAGKAIIGSNVGGISTLIKDGYSGFLINPYNVDGIIKNIENLIDNSELCYFFSKNARNQILNDNTSVEILKFYNGFVKRKD